MKVVIYARVSTQNQDYARQTAELSLYAQKMDWEIAGIYEEKVSGYKANNDRPVLSSMLSFIRTNHIDKVICWELSRLGRNTVEVLRLINELNSMKTSLYIKNYNIETLTESGDVNPLSQFMLQVLSSIAEMERSSIRQRVASGYDNYLRTGGRVGRKSGYKKAADDILAENKDVVKLLKQGFSVRKIMKLTDKSSGLVQKVKKLAA